jgi:hypothetical protein
VTSPEDAQATTDAGMATPAATPGATPVSALATPAASPMASPVAPAASADPLGDDLMASATAIAGCLSDAQYGVLGALTSDAFRGQLLGFNEPLEADDFLALSTLLPEISYQIMHVDDATFTGEDTATATVTYEMSHQVRRSTWEFRLQPVEGTTTWVLERETALEPVAPANTATVTVTIEGSAYEVSPATVTGPSVAIEATNTNDDVNEVLVVRLAEGTTTRALLETGGQGFPEGVDFVGQVTVFPGETATLLLSGLPAGTYTIVDLLPNSSGLPNLVDGMTATFEVGE